MPNNDIVYLLKFAPKEAYIDGPINGRLFMNAASYHHGLSGEQGDPLEASMVPLGMYLRKLPPAISDTPSSRRLLKVSQLPPPKS